MKEERNWAELITKQIDLENECIKEIESELGDLTQKEIIEYAVNWKMLLELSEKHKVMITRPKLLTRKDNPLNEQANFAVTSMKYPFNFALKLTGESLADALLNSVERLVARTKAAREKRETNETEES